LAPSGNAVCRRARGVYHHVAREDISRDQSLSADIDRGGEFLAILKKRCEEILGQENRGALKSAKRTGMLWSSTMPASTKALPYIAPQVVLRKRSRQ